MYKIAIIEEFHKSGLDLFDKNKNFSYEIINDTSEDNLIKKLPNFDGCTLRVTKLNSKILSNCPKLNVVICGIADLVTMEVDPTRVRIRVDSKGIVSLAPETG